jgi:hypothetical protein
VEIGGGPSGGVFAAVDVHYPSSGGARAAGVVAADAAFSVVLAESTAVVPEVMAYRPGEFFRRELPPLRAVLRGVRGLALLMVDGYADLDAADRPGLGAHAHAEFGVPVIGVAKSAFRTAIHAVPVLRGPPRARCSSPLPECPGTTQLTWSGTWLAASGSPTPCAASMRSPAKAGLQVARPATVPADWSANCGKVVRSPDLPQRIFMRTRPSAAAGTWAGEMRT